MDHNKRFIDLLVGFPGSVNDGRVWANSALKRKHEHLLAQLPVTPVYTKQSPTSPTCLEHVPAFILGDSAYPNTSRMVPTFKLTEQRKCSLTSHLNEQLAGVRYVVENAYGILKGRFRLLNRDLECATEDITRATTLITAIFTLHNFLIDEQDETPIEPVFREIVNDEEEEQGEREGNNSIKTRDILWRARCKYEHRRR